MIIQNKIFVVNECRNILRELMIKSVVIFLLKKTENKEISCQYNTYSTRLFHILVHGIQLS